MQPQTLAASASTHMWRARQQFRHVHRDAVSVHDHRPLGHRQIVSKDADCVFFGGIQLDDGAATKPQHLVNSMDVVPSTTVMSTATLSSVATFLPYIASQRAIASRYKVTMVR